MRVHLQTLAHAFKARLSRKIVWRVFLSIVAIEVVILLPSYWRRERELLTQLEAVSETAVDAMVRLTELGLAGESQLLDTLEVIARDPLVRGFSLYRRDGSLVGEFGELPELPFGAIEDFDRAICGRKWQGDRYDVARSIRTMDKPYVLIVRHDASGVQPELYRFILRITGLVLIIALVVTLATWYTVQEIVIMPLLRLRDDLNVAGDALTQGRPRPEFAALSEMRDDELGETIATFAGMFDRVEAEIQRRQAAEAQLHEKAVELQQALQDLQQAQLQLIQTEKMTSLGQLVAGIAHEINNPIGFIAGNTGALEGYFEDLLELIAAYQQTYPQPPEALQTLEAEVELEYLQEDIPQLLASMKTGTDRVRDIVRSLRNFARLDESERKLAHLHDGLDNTLLLSNGRLEKVGIQIRREYGEIPEIECYPALLNQVFVSILTNAIEAIEDKLAQTATAEFAPEIVLSTALSDEVWLRVKVADNGKGMTPEVAAKVFDPFFTTKPVGQGTGLGLATAYQIVVGYHGGEIECHSQVGWGTEIVVKLPIAPPSGS